MKNFAHQLAEPLKIIFARSMEERKLTGKKQESPQYSRREIRRMLAIIGRLVSLVKLTRLWSALSERSCWIIWKRMT